MFLLKRGRIVSRRWSGWSSGLPGRRREGSRGAGRAFVRYHYAPARQLLDDRRVAAHVRVLRRRPVAVVAPGKVVVGEAQLQLGELARPLIGDAREGERQAVAPAVEVAGQPLDLRGRRRLVVAHHRLRGCAKKYLAHHLRLRCERIGAGHVDAIEKVADASGLGRCGHARELAVIAHRGKRALHQFQIV